MGFGVREFGLEVGEVLEWRIERICLVRWGNSEIEKKVGEGVDYRAHRSHADCSRNCAFVIGNLTTDTKSFVAFFAKHNPAMLLWVKKGGERE